MTMIASAPTQSIDRVAQIFQSALSEHPDYTTLNEEELKRFIAIEEARISGFEGLGQSPIKLSAAQAHSIGAIKVHSSVGSYDEPYKEDDNPRLKNIDWLAWADRDRIKHGAYLARKVAETRSGYTIPAYPLDRLHIQKEETKALIREYGPNLIYTGYPVETAKATEVLNRIGGIIPIEKCFIVHGTPRNTVEGIQQFILPEGALARDKELAIVSHAPHLARILHIMGQYPYLPAGSLPYVAPVATPESGRLDFALMEIRGMLNYVFRDHVAAVQAHPYQTLAL